MTQLSLPPPRKAFFTWLPGHHTAWVLLLPHQLLLLSPLLINFSSLTLSTVLPDLFIVTAGTAQDMSLTATHCCLYLATASFGQPWIPPQVILAVSPWGSSESSTCSPCTWSWLCHFQAEAIGAVILPLFSYNPIVHREESMMSISCPSTKVPICDTWKRSGLNMQPRAKPSRDSPNLSQPIDP